MFFVINKDKIGSYIILLSTVVILFGLAFNMGSKDVVETSTNVEYVVNSIENSNMCVE